MPGQELPDYPKSAEPVPTIGVTVKSPEESDETKKEIPSEEEVTAEASREEAEAPSPKESDKESLKEGAPASITKGSGGKKSLIYASVGTSLATVGFFALYASSYSQHKKLYNGMTDENGEFEAAGEVDFEGVSPQSLVRKNKVGQYGATVMGAATIGLGATLVLRR